MNYYWSEDGRFVVYLQDERGDENFHDRAWHDVYRLDFETGERTLHTTPAAARVTTG